jgi:hypothetical protein
MRERVELKSPVREYRPPGSVRGVAANRHPYRDTGTLCVHLRFQIQISDPNFGQGNVGHKISNQPIGSFRFCADFFTVTRFA